MINFRDNLKLYAHRHGKDGLYHETITFAFMLLIHERMQRAAENHAVWEDFVRANADLIGNGKAFIRSLYKEQTLASDKARDTFLLPDKLPWPWPKK